MKKLLEDFSGNFISRNEMKIIKGGQCYYNTGGTVQTCSGAASCSELVNLGWGTNWCCDSCGSASWCRGGQCPQA